MRPALALGVAAAIGLGIGGPVTAQVVNVRVIEPAKRIPVAGALISLREDPTVALVQGLTDAAGRIALHPPRPGRYFVRLDRIGYLGTTVGPIVVAAGDTIPAEIVASADRVALAELAVTSGTRAICRLDPEASAVVSLLYAEARKVLLGTELTKLPLLEVTRFERGYAPGSSIVEQTSTRFRTDSVAPFFAATAEMLRADGYLQRTGGGTRFFAPDARTLLSDEFLTEHCFHAVEAPAGSGLIGLGFEPIPDQDRPDVSGTLWLDRATSELKYLEFAYRNLKGDFRTGNEGGRVDYLRLPNGGWIVAKWRARVAWHERGGEVAVVGPDGTSPAGAILVGTVFDSLAGRPLAGAIVSVAGGAYVDTTDADGGYRLEVPLEGTFSVLVAHPRFSLVDWRPSAGGTAVVRGQEVRLDFAVPGTQTVLERACADRAPAAGEAVVLGQVTDSVGRPLPGEVVIGWTEPVVLRARRRISISERGGWIVAPTDLEGRFRVCGVPAGVELSIGRRIRGRAPPPAYRATPVPGGLVIVEMRER